MEEEKRGLREWAHDHKLELTATGVGVAVGIAGFLLFRNWGSVTEAARAVSPLASAQASMPSAVTRCLDVSDAVATASGKAPHVVSLHVRNLPAGVYASSDKIAQAAAMGLELAPGQTWVKPYMTGIAA